MDLRPSAITPPSYAPSLIEREERREMALSPSNMYIGVGEATPSLNSYILASWKYYSNSHKITNGMNAKKLSPTLRKIPKKCQNATFIYV